MLQDEHLRSHFQFYLNIVVKNKDQVIKQGVKEKLPRFGGMLGKIANKVVTKDKFSQKLMATLQTKIPTKMASQGITATAYPRMHQANLLVMMVEIEHVDVQALVKTKN